jgi:hypothetical protein
MNGVKEMQEQVYSALDLAEALNINRNSVYYQVKNGSLPKPSMKKKTRKRGPHTYVWKRSDLENNPYFKKATLPVAGSEMINKAFVQQYSANVQMLAQQKGAALRKAEEMREELGLSEIKNMVTDNELLRDAIEMRLDKLEENMKLLENIVNLMSKKEKKWWQI